MKSLINYQSLEESLRIDTLKKLHSNIFDLFYVQFEKADGSMRTMICSKIEKSRERERQFDIEQQKFLEDGTKPKESRMSPEHVIRVFEVTVVDKTQYNFQWRTVDLRKVVLMLPIGEATPNN